MIFNNLTKITQNRLKFLYENSYILQNIDKLILISVLSVFVFSTFTQSDSIGFIALITILLSTVKLITKPDEKISLNMFEIFLLAYFMIVIISVAGSTLFALSLKGFLKTFVYIGFYFSVANYLKNNMNKIPLIVGTVALCAGFESIVAILQNFSHVEEISTWQDVSNINPEDVMTRVYGTLKPLNPNLLGGYFVATIPAALGMTCYYLYKKDITKLIIAGLISLLSIIALVYTGCRGAYIGLFVILTVAFFITAKFFWKKFKMWYTAFICGVFSFTIIVLSLVSAIRKRVFSIFSMRNDSSNSFRFNVYQSALKMFHDNWLLGIGVGNKNFREIYGLYMKTGFDALSAYNIFLETAVESGIFALIAFLGFVILTIKESVKIVLNYKNIVGKIFISVSLMSIIGLMFHGLVDTVFFRPQIQFVFWTMVAIVSAYKKDFVLQ